MDTVGFNYVLCIVPQAFPHTSVGKESTCNSGDPSSIPGSGRSPGEEIRYPLQFSWDFLVALPQKICLQCRRPGFDPWVGKVPWRRERLPTLVFWPGEFHGLYCPWDHKELDTSDFHFHFSCSSRRPSCHFKIDLFKTD